MSSQQQNSANFDIATSFIFDLAMEFCVFILFGFYYTSQQNVREDDNNGIISFQQSMS